jgi:hypothetical protein
VSDFLLLPSEASTSDTILYSEDVSQSEASIIPFAEDILPMETVTDLADSDVGSPLSSEIMSPVKSEQLSQQYGHFCGQQADSEHDGSRQSYHNGMTYYSYLIVQFSFTIMLLEVVTL